MMLYFIMIVVQGIIFGFATKTVIENKGYEDNWFWWGFFFGIIALIVASAKPQNISYSTYGNQPSQSNHTNYSSSYSSNLSKAANDVHNQQLLATGGWKCSCGRVNASYVSSCSCGKSKREILDERYKKKQENEKKQEDLKKQEETKKQVENMDETSKVSAIKEYKELMDEGIISREEFEAKKKQLLGL